MSNYSVGGLISGFDTESIVQSMMDVERIPVKKLEIRKASQLSLVTAYQAMSARLIGLKVPVDNLLKPTTFQGRTVTSSDDKIVSATVSNAALANAHHITNIQMAQAHRIAGTTFSDATTKLNLEGDVLINGSVVRVAKDDTLTDIAARINSTVSNVSASVLSVSDTDKRLVLTSKQTGTDSSLDLRDANDSGILKTLGLTSSTMTVRNPIADGANSGLFAVKTTSIGSLLRLSSPAVSGTIQILDDNGSLSVSVDLATDSIESIAQKINDAGHASISASVVEETNGGVTRFRLQITGAVTPAGEPFSASNFVDDNGILESLGILRAGYGQELTEARNATFDLDGITMTRSSNLVSDAITGMTFSLLKDSTETVTLSVASDQSPTVSAVQSFVDNYNATLSYIKEQTFYNKETGSKGLLLSDNTTRGIRNLLASMIGRQVPMLSMQNLTSLNDGSGVSSGSIKITNRADQSATIDLSRAVTVQDVLIAINSAGIRVTASVAPNGTGILLTDTSGGSGSMKVEEVDGGATAADLGILGNTYSSTLYGKAVADAQFKSLSDIGISLQTDGTLSLNATTLRKALESDQDK
ncbi:MAG TPA: flagellar filament capping protein FliD, partial [bacterium]|nr:flagellar filament capping protein FliD [bacterium]